MSTLPCWNCAQDLLNCLYLLSNLILSLVTGWNLFEMTSIRFNSFTIYLTMTGCLNLYIFINFCIQVNARVDIFRRLYHSLIFFETLCINVRLYNILPAMAFMYNVLLDVSIELASSVIIIELLCRVILVEEVTILLVINWAAVSTMEYLYVGKLGCWLICVSVFNYSSYFSLLPICIISLGLKGYWHEVRRSSSLTKIFLTLCQRSVIFCGILESNSAWWLLFRAALWV